MEAQFKLNLRKPFPSDDSLSLSVIIFKYE